MLAFLMMAYLSSGSASRFVEDLTNLSEVNVALGRAVQVSEKWGLGWYARKGQTRRGLSELLTSPLSSRGRPD